MPVYEYKCQHCSFQFELKQSYDDKPVLSCPKCQGKAHRLFSPVPIFFKGPGFYTTDKSEKDKSRDQKPGTDECLTGAKQTTDKALNKATDLRGHGREMNVL